MSALVSNKFGYVLLACKGYPSSLKTNTLGVNLIFALVLNNDHAPAPALLDLHVNMINISQDIFKTC